MPCLVSGTPFNILFSSNRSFFSEINHIISKIYNLLSTEREIVPIQNLAHFLMLPPELSGDEIISMRGWGVKLIARKVQRSRGKMEVGGKTKRFNTQMVTFQCHIYM